MYEGGAEPQDPARFRMRLGQIFAPGEYVSLALTILREHDRPMNTSELAAVIIARKGWSADDLLLKRSLIKRLAEMLKKALKRGKIGTDGMVRNVRVWRVPEVRSVGFKPHKLPPRRRLGPSAVRHFTADPAGVRVSF